MSESIRTMADILKNYEDNKTKKAKGQKTSTDLTKYFSISLPENVSEGRKVIRILSPRETDPETYPFNDTYFHNIKIGKNFRKIYDPGKNDKEYSPLNEVGKELHQSGDPTDKDLAKEYYSKPFGIIRLIDRDNEKDGVKFWRHSVTTDGTGFRDKFLPLIQELLDNNSNANIFDNMVGRDIVLYLKKPEGKKYTIISQVSLRDPSPLSKDQEQADKWLSDPIDWRDYYKKYPTDYLKIIAQKMVPVWDEDKQTYIAKTENSGEHNSTDSNVVDEDVSETSYEISSSPAISADDLPF